ncbi:MULTISPECIES: trypsin-like serine protease [Micromonospora]|uniref:trypsin-like serine protease n=1 Tax=Micromonospora TaxID=1873 RepID=UPI00341E3D84
MKPFRRAVLAVLCGAVLVVGPQTPASAITGGTTTSSLHGQVQIWNNGGANFRCTGSLIHVHYVLTAAHCLHSSRLVIKAGDKRLGSGQRIIVDGTAVAPKGYDMAVLHLASNVTQSNLVVPYSRDTALLKTGVTVAIRGWGQTETNGPPASTLRVCSLRVERSIGSELELEGLDGVPLDGDSGAAVWQNNRVQAVFTHSDDALGGLSVPTGFLAGWIKSVSGVDGID